MFETLFETDYLKQIFGCKNPQKNDIVHGVALLTAR